MRFEKVSGKSASANVRFDRLHRIHIFRRVGRLRKSRLVVVLVVMLGNRRTCLTQKYVCHQCARAHIDYVSGSCTVCSPYFRMAEASMHIDHKHITNSIHMNNGPFQNAMANECFFVYGFCMQLHKCVSVTLGTRMVC